MPPGRDTLAGMRLHPLVAGLLLAACTARRGPDVALPDLEPGQGEREVPSPVRITAEARVEGLLAAACGPTGCVRVDARGVSAFDPVGLGPQGPSVPLPLAPDALLSLPDGFRVEGTCGGTPCAIRVSGTTVTPLDPPVTPGPASASPEEIQAWNAILGKGWRLPFARSVPLRGGLLTYTRGFGTGAARLMRTGGRLRLAPAPDPPGPVTAEGWLCPRPTGDGAWFLLWPDPTVRLLDGVDLHVQRSVPLPGPAVGLFLDPGGRWLLVGRTAVPDPGALQDWPARPLRVGAARDPLLSDWVAYEPPVEAVVVVDGRDGVVAATVEGAFRAWIPLDDGVFLLATDRTVVRIEPRRPAGGAGAPSA